MDRAGSSEAVEASSPVVHEDPGGPQGTAARVVGRYQMLQGALVALQIGPALIPLILVALISLTTPVFFTSRNLGNVLSQTAVIAVLALGQLLVIVSRGIDLSVGSTIALSGVVGAIVFEHVHFDSCSLVGFDGLPDEVTAVKAGTESATVAQHPVKIGSLGVPTLYNAVLGKKAPRNDDTGTAIITKTNAK